MTRPDPSVVLLGLEWQGVAPGGLNRYVADLHRELRRAGVETTTLVEGDIAGAPDGVRSTGRVTRPLPVRLRAWSAAVRGTDADIVDAHFALSGIGPVLLGGLRGRPLVVHFHGPWAAESAAAGTSGGPGIAAKRRIERAVYRRAARVVVLSGAFRDVLIDSYGVPAYRVEVIPPGVDRARFTPGDRDEARARLGWATGTPTAFAVRRLVPRMGLDVLVRAWSAVTPGDARLVIAGDGPERASLEQLSRDLGVADRVQLVGRVVDDEVLADCYRAADVVVLPTVALEGFGLVAAEALSCGTPVVASDVGGLPDALQGLPADLLVPPGDASALAARLTAAFTGAAPLPSRAQCRVSSERFDWPAVTARHVQLYRDVTFGKAVSGGSRRLRVVYVDHTAVLSGAELAMLRLIPALADVDPHVILGADGPLVGALRAAGISVEVLPLGPVGHRRREGGAGPAAALAVAPATLRLARRLRELRPDLVHTNSLKANLYGGAAARLAGVPVVWHQHDRLAADYLSERTASTVRRLADRIPNAVIACSRAALATLDLRRRPGTAIPSVGAVVPRPRPRGTGAPIVVGGMSRFAPWKGQDVLLAAFAEAFGGSDAQERLVLHGEPLFGEDDYAARVREDARRLGVADRVTFAGFAEDVPAALRVLDVVVHCPVIPEPFGQVVPEAMASGAAVVTSTEGGPAEVVTDGVDGLLVPPGDVAGLAAALRRLADDPGLRARLGDAAVRTSERYTAAAIAPQVRAVYDDVLAGR